MTPTQKTLELRMKVTADVTDAQRNLQQLGQAAAQAQAGPGGRPFSGYAPPPGFGAPPALGPAAPRPGFFGSSVPAFDRPIPVVIVGPRPLLVSGGTGTGSGTGTGTGAAGGASDRTEALLASLRNLQLGPAVARYEQIKGFGDAAGELGIPGGKLIGRAALPAAIALSALKTSGEVGDIVSDEYTTDEQKARQAFRKFVPFGGTIQESVDGLTGRKAAFEKAEVDYQKKLVEGGGRVELAAFNLTHGPEQAGNEARASLLARATPILEGSSDRTTAAGEKAFRDRQRLLPLLREEARLQREVSVAAAQRAAADLEVGRIENRSRVASSEERQAKGRLSLPDNQSGAERQRTLYDQGAANKEAQGFGSLERQARTGLYEASKREAQTRRQLGQVGVQKLQLEADILEGDASQAASGAQSLGGQDRFARANAVRSLRLLQQFGPERLSPQEIAEARSVAPQTVAKLLEQVGKGTREFDQLRELAPADYAGDPDELRRKAQEKRDEAVRKELDLERDLASAAATAGAELGKHIANVIRRMTSEAIKEVDIQKLIGKGHT